MLLLLGIPVGAGASAAQEPQVPVAARDLPRGVVLTGADIRMGVGPGVGRSGELGEAGWVTRRVVRAGEVLRAPAVGRPRVVKSGDEVEVRWAGGAVSVVVRGVAAGSAGVGERVRVRLGTGWRIEGVVIGPALIEIQSPGRAER